MGTKRFVDAASLVAFRWMFGLAMAANAVRYELNGWVEQLFIAPTVRFPYWGFEWLPSLSPAGVHAVFALNALSALVFATGRFYRVALSLFIASFLYLELLDRANYLNHYYLVTLLSVLLLFMPLSRGALRRGVPIACVWVLRAQLTLVYVFAGIAKLRPDWLFDGVPLGIWLPRHSNLPVVGAYFDEAWVALAMSWAGAAFDLFVAFFLWSKRFRRVAYLAVIVFHALTAFLFPIGVFPWLMVLAGSVFFAPEWPRRLFKGAEPPPAGAAPSWRVPHWARAALAVFFVFQVAFPLRHWLYPGRSDWHEQGFRFSWNVMVMEKVGVTEFRVVDASGGETVVHPREELTPFQLRMMSTQPDLILTYAHHLRERWRDDGRGEVSVYADAWVSINGRRRARLIDPAADLARERESFAAKTWILPAPQ